jgi:hypothetical protein
VPVDVGDAFGFCRVDVKPDGPVQDHALAPVEFEESVTVPPTQIGPLFVAPEEVGAELTVTVVVYTVVGLQPVPELLTVSE